MFNLYDPRDYDKGPVHSCDTLSAAKVSASANAWVVRLDPAFYPKPASSWDVDGERVRVICVANEIDSAFSPPCVVYCSGGDRLGSADAVLRTIDATQWYTRASHKPPFMVSVKGGKVQVVTTDRVLWLTPDDADALSRAILAAVESCR